MGISNPNSFGEYSTKLCESQCNKSYSLHPINVVLTIWFHWLCDLTYSVYFWPGQGDICCNICKSCFKENIGVHWSKQSILLTPHMELTLIISQKIMRRRTKIWHVRPPISMNREELQQCILGTHVPSSILSCILCAWHGEQ